MSPAANSPLQRPLAPQPRQDATGPAKSALGAGYGKAGEAIREANRAGVFGASGSRPVAAEPVDENGSVATCYLAHLGDCDGRLDPAHVIPQRVLKREHARANPRHIGFGRLPLYGVDLTDLLADRRNIIPLCRSHHHKADHGFIEMPVPESAREFAAEFDLDHYLPVRETVICPHGQNIVTGFCPTCTTEAIPKLSPR